MSAAPSMQTASFCCQSVNEHRPTVRLTSTPLGLLYYSNAYYSRPSGPGPTDGPGLRASCGYRCRVQTLFCQAAAAASACCASQCTCRPRPQLSIPERYWPVSLRWATPPSCAPDYSSTRLSRLEWTNGLDWLTYRRVFLIA